MKKIFLILFILLFSSFPAYGDDSTFCNDPKKWEDFETLAEKYPDDVPVQILHALKIGLCVKIGQNSISTIEAINLFNDMVDTVANKRGDEEEQEKKNHW
jgi:hypothetical protein